MEQEKTSSAKPIVYSGKGIAVLHHMIKDLPYMLAFFQFMLVYLPFGFCNLAGINVPYTDPGFIAGMLVLLFASGFAFGLICVLLIKLQRKAGPPGSWTFFENRPLIVAVISYAYAVISMILYFVEIHGWLSEIGPMMLYFVGILISGTLAMFGLMAKNAAHDDRVPDISIAIAVIVIGVLWLLPAMFGLQLLLIDDMIIAIAIPPMISLERFSREGKLPDEEPATSSKTFAWCDKVLATGDGPRAWIGTTFMLFLTITLGYLFSAIFYLKTPIYAFAFQVFMFCVGTSASILVFMVAFKNRKVDILIFVTLGILIVLLLVGDLVFGFAYTPLALLVDGVGAGGALTMIFKLQDTRNDISPLKDFAGSRIVEIYYYVFLAAILGLGFSFSISLEDLLKKPSPYYFPSRLILGGIVLAFAIIILLVLNFKTQHLINGDRGKVAMKAESMEELMYDKQEGDKKIEREKKKQRDKCAFLVILGICFFSVAGSFFTQAILSPYDPQNIAIIAIAMILISFGVFFIITAIRWIFKNPVTERRNS